MPRPPLPQGPFLVVGLARSGVAVARVLAHRGERVIGVDAGSPELAGTLTDSGVELHLGEDGTTHLKGIKTLVKSPGVPEQAPVIQAARRAGLDVLGELELGWRMLPNEFIAVTGTNGKTTTVELIGHIHRQAGLPVAVAGNVGTALSSLVGETPPAVRIVCEASSFQLQDTLAFAPEAAVLLNLQPDHLDRHGTLENYRRAKLRIFALQGEGDLAVLPNGTDPVQIPGDARRISFGGRDGTIAAKDGRLWWRGEPLLEVGEVRLPGEHNLQNAMAAAAVCLERGVPPEAVRAALESFPGVPHRLEEIATLRGVRYVNDSKATNLASTLVALRSFPQAKIHLILGGQGKGQDFTPLAGELPGRCRAVYLIGEDAPAIATALRGADVEIYDCGDLPGSVSTASRRAVPGEVVLLSPACASFDQFTDFQARGDAFREIVKEL